MTMKNSLRTLGFVVVGILSLPSAFAQQVVSGNLSEPGGVGTSFVQDGQWKGQSFTTDNDSYTLDQVTLEFVDAADASGNLFVHLYDDNAGLPGSMVLGGALGGSSNPATAGQYVYLANTSLLLSANTPYWIVAGVSAGDGDYRWATVDSDGETGPFPLGNDPALSFNTGGSWSLSTNLLNQRLEVTATAVPEPASVVLLSLALPYFSRRAFRRR